MLDRPAETRQQSLFDTIFEAACARDLKTLTEMSKITNLAVKQGAYDVISQLLLDGKKDAVNFLRENFALQKKPLVRGYSLINDVDEVNRILETIDDAHERAIKISCLYAAMFGYAFCKNKDELKNILNQADLLITSSYSLEINGTASQIKGLIYSGQIVEAFVLCQSARRTAEDIIRTFGLLGNIDMVTQLITKNKKHPNIKTYYIAAVSGLARGNHVDKLSSFLSTVPENLHDKLLASQVRGFATRNLQDQARTLINQAKPELRSDLLYRMACGFIQGGYYAAAVDVIPLELDENEKHTLALSLVREWVSVHNPLASISFIENYHDKTQTIPLKKILISGLLKLNLLKYAYDILAIASPESRIQLLQTLMVGFAEVDDRDQIKVLLNHVQHSELDNVRLARVFGYVKGDKRTAIAKYFENEIGESQTKLFFCHFIIACFDLDLLDRLSVAKLFVNKSTKNLFNRMFVTMYKDNNYKTKLNTYLKNKSLDEFWHTLLDYLIRYFAILGDAKEIICLLQINQQLPAHLYFGIANQLAQSNRLEKAIVIYKAISEVQHDADTFTNLVIPLFCDVGDIGSIIQFLNTAASLDQLAAMFKIIKPELYNAKCFSTFTSAVLTLAAIHDICIRKNLAKELEKHKNLPQFKVDKLLAAVIEKRQPQLVRSNSSPAFFAEVPVTEYKVELTDAKAVHPTQLYPKVYALPPHFLTMVQKQKTPKQKPAKKPEETSKVSFSPGI